MSNRKKARAAENEHGDGDAVSSIDSAGSHQSLFGTWNIKPISGDDRIGGAYQTWVNRWVVLVAQFVVINEGKNLLPKKPDMLMEFEEWYTKQIFFTTYNWGDEYASVGKSTVKQEATNRVKYRNNVFDFALQHYTNKDVTPWKWCWNDDVVWYNHLEDFFVEFPSSKAEVKVMIDCKIMACGVYAYPPPVSVEKMEVAKAMNSHCKFPPLLIINFFLLFYLIFIVFWR